MSLSYIIEVDDFAVGLVLRDSALDRFHFVASDNRVLRLDGQSFRRPSQAEKAARLLLGRGCAAATDLGPKHAARHSANWR